MVVCYWVRTDQIPLGVLDSGLCIGMHAWWRNVSQGDAAFYQGGDIIFIIIIHNLWLSWLFYRHHLAGGDQWELCNGTCDPLSARSSCDSHCTCVSVWLSMSVHHTMCVCLWGRIGESMCSMCVCLLTEHACLLDVPTASSTENSPWEFLIWLSSSSLTE